MPVPRNWKARPAGPGALAPAGHQSRRALGEVRRRRVRRLPLRRLDPSERAGASVGYRNAAGQSLAQAWKHAYEQRGWSGGFRDDNYTENLKKYYGTRKAVEAGNQRAFIAECGFLTNRDDKALLTGPGGVNRVVHALFDALGI